MTSGEMKTPTRRNLETYFDVFVALLIRLLTNFCEPVFSLIAERKEVVEEGL